MRLLTIVALCLALDGCFFFYYKPAEDQPGNTCITQGFFAGDKIRNEETGKIGVIERVYGNSDRCKDPSHPNLADVRY